VISGRGEHSRKKATRNGWRKGPRPLTLLLTEGEKGLKPARSRSPADGLAELKRKDLVNHVCLR